MGSIGPMPMFGHDEQQRTVTKMLHYYGSARYDNCLCRIEIEQVSSIGYTVTQMLHYYGGDAFCLAKMDVSIQRSRLLMQPHVLT